MTEIALPAFERHATVTKVVDGDTLWLSVDLGCDTQLRMSIRLAGINAPETSTPEGRDAALFAADWVRNHGPVFVLRTLKDRKEKYGRYLADLLPADATPSLCNALLEAGHAAPYGG